MQRRPTISTFRRVLAAALAIAGAATVAWGDAIQFSKPAVAIPTRPKEQLNLPERKSRDVDFSSPADMQQPLAPPPPPPVVRVPPREREDNDDAGKHPLLRDPKNFPDAVGRADARNPLAPSKASATAPRSTLQIPGAKAPEAQHALAPISDINLDLRDRDLQQRRRDPAAVDRMDHSLSSDRNEPRKRDSYLLRQNAPETIDPFNSASRFDPLMAHPKENVDAQHLERRAAFDQLLNPGANVVRTPGSLDPVTGLESSKPASPVAMPMLGSSKFEINPADPANGIRLQQERLRAPVAETVNKKYSQPAKPVAAGAFDSPFQSSLMRQPTIHEIPARKF